MVTRVAELPREPEDSRPEATLQICWMNRESRNTTTERLKHPPEPVADISEPTPAAAIPTPRRQGNLAARSRLEGEVAQHVIQPEEISVIHADVSALPGRCDESSRWLSEHFDEDTLSALECAARFVEIETVHLVAALGEQRDRPPASLPLVEVAVKKKFLAALSNQPAILGMCRKRPLAMPVGHDGDGESATENGSKVREYRASLTRVGWRGIVETDKKALQNVHCHTGQ